MAAITFFVPKLDKAKFTGGLWTIFQYANGLAEKGHTVRVFPVIPSPQPVWHSGPAAVDGFADDSACALARITLVCRMILLSVLALLPFTRLNETLRTELLALWGFALSGKTSKVAYQIIKCAVLVHARAFAPNADVSVATSYQTALAVSEFASGKKFYFLQHFESIMCDEARDRDLCLNEVSCSYNAGMSLIANSTWVREQVGRVAPQAIALCLNAINHDIFCCHSIRQNRTNHVVVISYGGRDAKWKGFAEMAEAMRIARQRLTNYEIEWRVYGDAMLPPDNEIAPYKSLGFLMPTDLAQAYRSADILLSASWYESFPLFPLEAMASGVAVITTAPGTEDYASDFETALIVQPQAPESVASALIRLISDPELRMRIAENGMLQSRRLNWPGSVARMEEILISGV